MELAAPAEQQLEGKKALTGELMFLLEEASVHELVFPIFRMHGIVTMSDYANLDSTDVGVRALLAEISSSRIRSASRSSS